MTRMGVGEYVLRRLILMVPTLFGVSLAAFAIVRAAPGDPARILAGMLASAEEVERLRRELGLDLLLPVQYVRYLRRLLVGDLGASMETGAPVLHEIGLRLGPTVLLAVVATALAALFGVLAGVLAATRRRTGWDYAAMMVALFGVSVPVFWLGLMLILVFAVRLQWLPAGGFRSPQGLILPAITLAAFSQAVIARMTRSSLLEVLGQDYVRTARAKGVPGRRVVWRHALRNALVPVVTVVGLQFGTLLGGSVLTETTFAWPGMGRLLVRAIAARDYTVIQGAVLVFALMFMVVNLVVDLLYAVIDPRVRYG